MTVSSDHRPVDELERRINIPEVWGPMWRGAVGGFLGLVIYVIYIFYTEPYYLTGGFSTGALLVVGATGMLVGALLFCISRLRRKRIGIVLRMLTGTLIGFCSIASYSYLEDGLLYNTFKQFVIDSLVLGLMLGACAGAMARIKLPRTRN